MGLFTGHTQRPADVRINRNCAFAQGITWAGGIGPSVGKSVCSDLSAYRRDGAFTAASTNTWKYSNYLNRYVMDFNGSSQNMIVPVNIPFSDVFTVSFWLNNRNASYGSNAYVIGQYDTGNSARMWAVFITSDGQYLRPATGASDGASGDTATDFDPYNPPESWFHVSVVWRCSARSYDLYTDGKFRDNTTPTTGYTTTQQTGKTSRLTIGGLVGSNWTNCQIADPVIHGRQLGDTEIRRAADPSNVMMSGFLEDPVRRWWPAVASSSISIPVFMNQYRQRVA